MLFCSVPEGGMYGDSRLVLMPLSSSTLFTYWEVDWKLHGLVARHFRRDWHNLPKYLKVYDITDIVFDGSNAHWTKIIPIEDRWGSCYIRNLNPDRSYCVDYGIYAMDGGFFTILRSNYLIGG